MAVLIFVCFLLTLSFSNLPLSLVSAASSSDTTGNRITIPGCPNVTTFQPADEFDREPAQCFCDAEPDSTTDSVISCLWGANLTTIHEIIAKAADLNVPVGHFVISAGGFTDPVPPRFFSGLNVRNIVIENCFSDLYLNDNVFANMSKGGAVRSLTINRCRPANESFFAPIAQLTSLTQLTLARSDVQHLPANAFSTLSSLKSLDMSGNFMNVIQPGAFEGLSALEELNLGSGNELNESALVNVLSVSGLRLLDLSRNKLQRISESFFAPLKRLESLDLRLNLFKNLTAEMFQGLDSLKTLDLRVNLIQRFPQEAFDGLSQLETLLLAGNFIANITRESFAKLPKLKTLDLSHNEVTHLEGGSFSNLRKLDTLLLCGNTDLKHLEPGMFSRLKKLKRLDLSSTSLESLGASSFNGLSSSLQVLNLDGNMLYKLEDNNTFKALTGLRQLYLNRTQLQTVAEGVFDPIQGNLSNLDISGNPWVCDQKLKWLVTWLKQQTTLDVFNLSNTVCKAPEKFLDRPLTSLVVEEMTDDLEITTQAPTTTTLSTRSTLHFNRATTTLLPPDPFRSSTAKTLLPQIGKNTTTTVSTTPNLQNVTLPVLMKQASDSAASQSSTWLSANAIGIIVGVVIAALVLLAVIVTTVVVKRRRSSNSNNIAHHTTSDPYSSNNKVSRTIESGYVFNENGLKDANKNGRSGVEGQTYL